MYYAENLPLLNNELMVLFTYRHPLQVALFDQTRTELSDGSRVPDPIVYTCAPFKTQPALSSNDQQRCCLGGSIDGGASIADELNTKCGVPSHHETHPRRFDKSLSTLTCSTIRKQEF
jgi:hypothetical protein